MVWKGRTTSNRKWIQMAGYATRSLQHWKPVLIVRSICYNLQLKRNKDFTQTVWVCKFAEKQKVKWSDFYLLQPSLRFFLYVNFKGSFFDKVLFVSIFKGPEIFFSKFWHFSLMFWMSFLYSDVPLMFALKTHFIS